MAAKTSSSSSSRSSTSSHPQYLGDEGLSTKKTALIIVTVIGCIAILWPKVFYPMMFGGTSPAKANTKEYSKGPGGCCDVVFDREQYANATAQVIGPQFYHKQLNLYTGEMNFHAGLRQERPAHLHPESIYQAMRERGRAIPNVNHMDAKISATNPPPRIVEGRPGPIPGMRPPMGAGAINQPQQKGSSMGILMPIYTIGIIVFFCYTLMKIIFKKPLPNAPYGPAPTDPNFRKEVFEQENGRHIEELQGAKLVVTAIQSLIDAADEELKLRENNATSDLSKINQNENTTSNCADISDEHTTPTTTTTTVEHEDDTKVDSDSETHIVDESFGNEVQPEQKRKDRKQQQQQQRKRRDDSLDRSVAVLGMEVTASCEGGQKWTGRPPTPVFFSHNEHSKNDEDVMPEPPSIYLEGALTHESQILVADSETKTEKVYDAELNGSPEEPAVVLSSKMTLSLINMDSVDDEDEQNKGDIESPLADDIEIIGHDEK